jgi:hypothetical protein
MRQFEVKELLNKYRCGSINQQEMLLLEAWYLEWKPGKEELDEEEMEAIKAEVWRNLSRQPEKKRRSNINYVLGAAAIICLIGFFSVFIFSSEDAVQVQSVKTDFPPGGNKALLSLSTGKKIVLTDSDNGIVGQEGDILIKKAEDGKIVYEPLASKSNEVLYNTLTTPRGGQYQTVLSDGTKVWLNASSSLEFPVRFIGSQRMVKIVGEAYFEVSHDKKRPFTVVCGNQEIQVLGTHFNVSSYPEDSGTATTLVNGSVQIKNIRSGMLKMLIPGQAAVIQKGSGGIDIFRANIDEALAWKQGYFIFDDQPITTIMKVMSRWYNVDIQYVNVDNTDRFGGTFSKSRNLSETLNNIEELGNVRFDLRPGKIIVKKGGKN